MADEEKTEQTEEQKPDEQAPEAEAPETPEAEAPAEEAPAEDAPKEDAPEEPSGDSAAPADASQPDTPAGEAEEVGGSSDEAMEGLNWKARQRLLRSRESGEAGPQKTPEERAAERRAKQAAAAKSRSSYRKKSRAKTEKREGTAPVARESAGRKTRQGRVVSDKADKTITVRIDVARRHPAYEKIVRTSSKLHAHDETNEAGEGDLVRIVETRPLSRSKRWRLVEVLEKAE
jgi:small subunit ribosomal protein S17